MEMSGYGLKNMLVEYFRHVSITKGGAVWTHHTTAILSYRTWLASIWEGVDNNSGKPTPVMFEGRAELENWADLGGHKLTPVCFSKKSKEPNAYFLDGNSESMDWYRGTRFLWVKANWKGYRKAFKIWLEQNRSGDSISDLHESAIICYERAIKLIESKGILASRPASETDRIVALIRKQILAHQSHVGCCISQPTGMKLLAYFDSTLDADHVVNKGSLKDLGDAWVLMAPVHADINRGYGAKVEKHLPKYVPDKKFLELSPLVAFKLFASFMPTSPRELEQAMMLVSGQLGATGELDVVIKTMYEEMKKRLAVGASA